MVRELKGGGSYKKAEQRMARKKREKRGKKTKPEKM